MALQLVTGDLNVDKKSQLMHKILEISQRETQAIIYYLVPDHLKFEMETYVLEAIQKIQETDQAATITIQVVSFKRLGWFLIRPQQHHEKTISPVGMGMVIRQLLRDLQEELIVFKGQVNHQGFVDKLMTLFQELRLGNVGPEDIETLYMIDEGKLTTDIDAVDWQRIKELQLLYQAYMEKLDQLDVKTQDELVSLQHYLSEHARLDNHYMIVDHYYYFNAQELNTILALARTFEQVLVTLPISHGNAQSTMYQPVFEEVKRTYQTIKQVASYQQLAIAPDWDISQPLLLADSPLAPLHQLFKDLQAVGTQAQALSTSTKASELAQHHVELWQADTIQTELRQVSNHIHYLVTEEGYRYQDIAVMTRDLVRYQAIIEPYFEANNIPIFFDNVAKMTHHPFVMLVESLLNTRRYGFRYEEIMGICNSPLILPDFISDSKVEEALATKNHEVNQFENILLANGYFGYRLTQQQFEWNFEGRDRQVLSTNGQASEQTLYELADKWRHFLVKNVHQYSQTYTADFNGAQAARWLYQWLIELGVKDQLIQLRDQSILMGDIENSRRHEQVWQVFVNILDEFHQLYGDQVLEYDLFVDLLLAGMTEATYHIIPATLDQVTITSLESPQAQPYKVVYLIGADEQALPRHQLELSLLEEEDRRRLNEHLLPHQSIVVNPSTNYSQELFLTYQFLLQATDRLFISYAATVNNQTLALSPYIRQLVGAMTIPVWTFTHNQLSNFDNHHPSNIGQFASLRSLVLQAQQELKESQRPLNRQTQAVLKQLFDYEARHDTAEPTLSQLMSATKTFHQLPQSLSADIALQLYGKDIIASVSKIEQFYQDPYSHFLIHGLKLRERKIYELDYARSGDYFHEVLDQLTRTIINNQTQLTELDEAKLANVLASVINQLGEDPRFNILSSHAKFLAIKHQMDQQIARFTQFTQQQSRLLSTRTLQSEAVFGINQALKGFSYKLESGGKLWITGKIDRIDTAAVQGQDYVQVVDYKSSKKEFNLVDTYYGMDLQILTYLSVATHNIDGSKPFGAFYQPILQPYVAYKGEDILATQLANNTYHGIIGVDEAILTEIDQSLAEFGKSKVYRASLKKDGSFNATSQVYSANDLQLLLAYVHDKFKQAANAIQRGHIALMPFKDNPYTPSLQLPYRVISGFDPTENYQAYRQKTASKKDVLHLIENELSKKEEHDDQ